MLKRVVVTGLSLVTPLGETAQVSFDRLCQGFVGIKPIPIKEYPEVNDLPQKNAGLLPASFDLAG